MRFVDLFDPKNPEHINAYLCLVDKGYWPVDFATEVDQSDRQHWYLFAMLKFTNAWLDYVDWKQRCKTEFIPTVSVDRVADTKKIADLVIKEINKRNSARGIKGV
jgi:hypothetical protein